MKESHARRKSGSRSPSGLAGTAPRRRAFGLVFRVVLVVFFVACAWLRRPSAKREGLWCGDSRTTMHKSRTCLCQAHATVPDKILVQFSYILSNENYTVPSIVIVVIIVAISATPIRIIVRIALICMIIQIIPIRVVIWIVLIRIIIQLSLRMRIS